MSSLFQFGRWGRLALTVGLLCGGGQIALAQHGGGGGGMGGGRSGGGSPTGGMSGGDSGMGRNHEGPPPGNSPDTAATTSTMRGGLQLGPPGRWWDDKHFAKNLQLRPEQQRQMDATFEANRASLLRHYEELQGEQTRMGGLVHSKTLDEGALFSQIDRVAQARADLEKAMTHLLLQIRGEMDPEQITRLEQHQ